MPTTHRLNVVYRVEPGCLGPTGDDLVDEFCQFARKKFDTNHRDMIEWLIEPRRDKALPEVQYKLNDKLLTREQAIRYLLMFDQDIEDFEESIEDLLLNTIDDFMDH